MPICKGCDKAFPNRTTISGKVRNISNRVFCLTCSPFGMHNTSSYRGNLASKRPPTLRQQYKTDKPIGLNQCAQCHKRCMFWSEKFCSPRCHRQFKYEQYIECWKNGEEDGNKGRGQVSNYIRRYLFERSNDKCEKCGWSKTNPKTGKIPLTVNHINGNWRDNRPENLELLCPNCHALTPTYGSLNRGNGRRPQDRYNFSSSVPL